MSDRFIILVTWIGIIVFCCIFWSMVVFAALSITVIDHDMGGDVQIYAERVEATTGRVLVRGKCFSACTMYLALEDRICTYRGAEWGFHGATSADPIMATIAEPYANYLLADSYPPVIKKQFEQYWSKLRSPYIHIVSGTKMIKMGVQEC